VVDGKVDIAGDFEEGSTVAVIGAVLDAPELTPAEEQELAEAFAAIRAGEFVDGRQLLADLWTPQARSGQRSIVSSEVEKGRTS
jgi:hypothetical protein